MTKEEVCKFCNGEEVILVPEEERVGGQRMKHPPAYRRCKCVLHRDILDNVERAMPGLSNAPKVQESPLLEYMDQNLWITAPANTAWFRANLRHVGIRQPPSWYFKVISDADLLVAWLASAALKGQEILDPDAAKVSLTHLTLVDLVVPPQLLIIKMGVKAARNVAAPEVFLETLNYRAHLNLPTWVWDQPTYKLDAGHICFDDAVGECLSAWAHVVKSDGRSLTKVSEGGYHNMTLPSDGSGGRKGSSKGRPTLSGGSE